MNALFALKKAVKVAGGQSALARRVKTQQRNVWGWLHRSKRVPPQYVIPIERTTGISRHDLRPDIFGRAT